MQWQTKVNFCGQVKPVGIERNMGWKMGFAQFDCDTDGGDWRVQLYLKVNPTKVFQQMKIRQSYSLDVKCGRLIVENKKGDGIHIKLSSNDVTKAKELISKIKNASRTTATTNKAEVGFSSNTLSFKHTGSQNVRPCLEDEDSLDLSILQGSSDVSQQPWLSKNTPPVKGQGHHAALKEKLHLFSSEGLDIDGLETELSSSQRFTRNLHRENSLSGTSGLGAKRFYGEQKHSTTNVVYGNTQTSSSHSFHPSPAPKRAKFASLSSTVDSSSMVHVRGHESNASSSPVEVNGLSTPRDISLQVSCSPRHRIEDGETVGFENLGNTCFLNAPLQCLSALEPLSLDIHLAVAQYGRDIKHHSVTRKLYLLMKDVRRLHVCPDRIKELLIKLRSDMNFKFAPNTQQDAHELLSELLNRVDEEVKVAMKQHSSRLPVSTQISASRDTALTMSRLSTPRVEGSALTSPMPTPTESNFCWSYRTCIYFHECKTEVFSQTEQEMTLMLALDSSTKNLQDCINKYFEKTEVDMKCGKCGRDEKATITRKIVQRPRVLILNLLRYHSDNLESTKKADPVQVPSYIHLGQYSASDVTRPALIDPVLLLDSVTETSELVDGLTDLVSCTLLCAKSYMEDANERGEDINDIYVSAQTIISQLKANITTALLSGSLLPEIQDSDNFGSYEALLSELLLKKALMLDDKLLDSLPEDTLSLVIDNLLVTQYGKAASKEKCMNNLIEDLGLCLAAVKTGALKSGSQERTSSLKNLHAVWDKHLCQKSAATSQTKDGPIGGSDVHIDCDSFNGSHVMVEDDIFFKTKGPLKDTQVDESSVVKTNQIVLRQSDLSDMRSYSTLDNEVDKQRCQPLSDISLQASCGTYLLQGRHVSSFTESELQTMDHASLTEDEMMLCAQALSRLAYEKEHAPVVGNSASEALATCDSFEKLSSGNQQAGSESARLQSSSRKDCTAKKSCSYGAEREMLVPESSCDSSPPTYDQPQKFAASSTGTSPSSDPMHKPDLQHDNGKMLFRDEFASEISVGNPCDLSCKKSSEVNTTNNSFMCSDIKAMKHCVSCGGECFTACTNSKTLDTCVSRLPAERAACPMGTENTCSRLCDMVPGKGDNPSLVQSSIADLKKTFPFSPPKTNLVKSKDYVRLKSPGLSPKKRISKGLSPGYDCVSKRLHFREKGSRLDQSDAGSEESVNGSNSEPHNTSMEVCDDDMSFYDSQQKSVNSAADSRCHPCTPASTCSTPSSRHRDPGQTLVDYGRTGANTPAVEGLVPSSLLSHLSAMQTETLDSPGHTARDRKVAANLSLHNNQPEVAVMPRRRLVRSLATYIPDKEEKENVHHASQLQNLMEGTRDLSSYKLVSVVDHTGSSQFTGHYTAYAFNFSRQQWFYLNDTETLMVREEQVREETTQSGYLFFYMDKDLFDEYCNKNSPSIKSAVS